MTSLVANLRSCVVCGSVAKNAQWGTPKDFFCSSRLCRSVRGIRVGASTAEDLYHRWKSRELAPDGFRCKACGFEGAVSEKSNSGAGNKCKTCAAEWSKNYARRRMADPDDPFRSRAADAVRRYLNRKQFGQSVKPIGWKNSRWLGKRVSRIPDIIRSMVRELTEAFFVVLCDANGETRERWKARGAVDARRLRYATDEEYREYVKLKSARTKRRRLERAKHHPEARRSLRAARWRVHAKKRAVEFGVPAEIVDRNTVYDNHGGICYLCGQYVDHNDFHVDHIEPLALGGPHTYANCRPTHPLCNLKKSDRPPLIALCDF